MSQWIEGVCHLDKEELLEVLNDSQSSKIIIDVREPEEYIAAHIPGVPLIPMNDIPVCAEELDRDQEYIFVCRSGHRSLMVAKYLQGLGFKHIYNYLGGMLEWDKEVRFGPERIIEEFSPDQLKRG